MGCLSMFDGGLFLVSVIGTALFGLVPASLFIFILVIAFPRLLPLYNFFIRKLTVAWFKFNTVLLKRFCGTKVFIYGELPKEEYSLLISNNRTKFDFIFLWSLFLNANTINFLKIVLKSSMRSIPAFGWACQLLCYVFLQRSWEHDEAYIDDLFTIFNTSCEPYSVLLFPEGNHLSQKSIEKSNEWARTNGLGNYKEVIHPRIRGFGEIMSVCQENMKSVYDITIGYPALKGGKEYNEFNVFAGEFPNEMHVLCTRHDMSTIPTEAEARSKWLQDIFKEKDRVLADFYENNRFDADLVVKPVEDGDIDPCIQSDTIVVGGWVIYLIVIVLLLIAFPGFRWYFFGMTLFLSILSEIGMDRIIMRRCYGKSQLMSHLN